VWYEGKIVRISMEDETYRVEYKDASSKSRKRDFKKKDIKKKKPRKARSIKKLDGKGPSL